MLRGIGPSCRAGDGFALSRGTVHAGQSRRARNRPRPRQDAARAPGQPTRLQCPVSRSHQAVAKNGGASCHPFPRTNRRSSRLRVDGYALSREASLLRPVQDTWSRRPPHDRNGRENRRQPTNVGRECYHVRRTKPTCRRLKCFLCSGLRFSRIRRSCANEPNAVGLEWARPVSRRRSQSWGVPRPAMPPRNLGCSRRLGLVRIRRPAHAAPRRSRKIANKFDDRTQWWDVVFGCWLTGCVDCVGVST
jgi:hypothetical protein